MLAGITLQPLSGECRRPKGEKREKKKKEKKRKEKRVKKKNHEKKLMQIREK